MKKELLSPAGNFECLKAAVHAGADAVYISGKKFGARKFAENFDTEALQEAVQYCHLYGVKLYVTVNTMIYEEEMKEVLEYIKFLYTIHVDAVIVQDIGLIWEIRKLYPGLEIHASTQLHNYSQENCQLLEELGVKRVVLARELSLNQIQEIKTPLEKEVFIHGAICISYSGQCLFSSLVLNRSGNRGECAGMCRLPYSLEGKNGKVETAGNYLLSPRELCTISKFQKLMESDITCFKIEGRMKSPSYVYFVTKIYRTLIDRYKKGKELTISEEDFEKLQILYNRKFTEGHLFEAKDTEFMNIQNPNHQGILLGKVLQIQKGKLQIQLVKDLCQEDGIRFVGNQKGMTVNFLYNEKGLLIHEAKQGQTVWIDNKVNLKTCCEVLKTTDQRLLKELTKYPPKKIPIKMKLIAKMNTPLHLEVSDGEHTIIKETGIIEKAKNQATQEKEVINHLNRLGNTIYTLENYEIKLDPNVFIPMSILNNLRQDAVQQMNTARCFRKDVQITTKYVDKFEKEQKKDVSICCLVRNEEQLQAALENKIVKRIYITNPLLYKKYAPQYKQIYYRMDRIHPSKIQSDNCMATELAKINKNSKITDYYLNVANSSYLEFLASKGIECATLSVEMNPQQIKNLAKRKPKNIDLEVLVYGRCELMIMKYCPLHLLINKNNQTCSACKDSYLLVDRNQKKYSIVTDLGITHLLSFEKERYSSNDMETIISSGIHFIRLEFFDETKKDVLNILEKYQEILQNHKIYDKIAI